MQLKSVFIQSAIPKYLNTFVFVVLLFTTLAAKSQVSVLTLGEGCYSAGAEFIGGTCQPAYLGLNQPSMFQGNLVFGNNIRNEESFKRLAQGEADNKDIEVLLNERRISQASGIAEIGYQRENFGIKLMPYKVYIQSEVSNQALPYVEFLGYEEKSLQLQVGTATKGPWLVGLNFRYSQKDYVAKDFYVSEVIYNPESNFFERKKQNSFAIEPGVVWAPEDALLQPEISLLISDWGFTDQKEEKLAMIPSAHAGITFGNASDNIGFRFGPFFRGTLKRQYQYEDQYLMGLAASLRVSQTQFFARYQKNEQAVGFKINIDRLSTGVGTINRLKELLDGSTAQEQSYFFELGFAI